MKIKEQIIAELKEFEKRDAEEVNRGEDKSLREIDKSHASSLMKVFLNKFDKDGGLLSTSQYLGSKKGKRILNRVQIYESQTQKILRDIRYNNEGEMIFKTYYGGNVVWEYLVEYEKGEIIKCSYWTQETATFKE